MNDKESRGLLLDQVIIEEPGSGLLRFPISFGNFFFITFFDVELILLHKYLNLINLNFLLLQPEL